MPPGQQPGQGEGMSAASGTAPQRENPGNGTDLTTEYAWHLPAPAPPGSGSPLPIIRLPASHLKDASGARSAGRAPPGP